MPWALQLIASSKLPALLLLLFPLHLPTRMNLGQPQLPDQMWERKKWEQKERWKTARDYLLQGIWTEAEWRRKRW